MQYITRVFIFIDNFTAQINKVLPVSTLVSFIIMCDIINTIISIQRFWAYSPGAWGPIFSRSLRPSKTFLKMKYYVWLYEKNYVAEISVTCTCVFCRPEIQKNRYSPLYNYIFPR